MAGPRARRVPLNTGIQVKPGDDACQGKFWKGKQTSKGLSEAWELHVECSENGAVCQLNATLDKSLCPSGLGFLRKIGTG